MGVGTDVGSSNPQKIIFDHDGGIDDFVTLLLLLSKPEAVRLLGVTILDADCYAAVAANTTLKLLHTLGFDDIPVAVSSLPGKNPFPDLWRGSPLSVDVQPLINNVTQASGGEDLARQLSLVPGQEFLAQLLLTQVEPVTIVATGPLSNVAYVLQKYGAAAASKIREVVWMGGAMWVEGNVQAPAHDGSAEWNAFWDPEAVGVVWNSSVPLLVVPLDATNAVPVTPELLYRRVFGLQSQYRYSVLAGTIWSRVITWVYERPLMPYYAWDTLTAACVMKPDLCPRTEGVQSYAVVTGPSQGRTAPAGAAGAAAAGTATVPAVACDAVNLTCTATASALAAGSDRASAAAGLAAAVAGLLEEGGGAEGPVEVSTTRAVSVVKHVDAEAFYSFVLESLRV
ncbi:hypothetical protein GPECTOR_115g323 [Gonium pectorale]|uniref:Inosine/uridine-preferring nucleoside hydrolase domain-containing protein n=1 Tax=Gonium pectorale TaxID=33097 RepID=A0A150FZ13_GONPE|nr:hypothetical protein GPECTOR_115g323 [Gonium pectorale]|eukprot:KXZ42829.1 hypothetical protein GPECTOR_115g323 [Gonium pectorale]